MERDDAVQKLQFTKMRMSVTHDVPGRIISAQPNAKLTPKIQGSTSENPTGAKTVSRNLMVPMENKEEKRKARLIICLKARIERSKAEVKTLQDKLGAAELKTKTAEEAYYQIADNCTCEQGEAVSLGFQQIFYFNFFLSVLF